MSHNLSKSRYVTYCYCPKHLWLSLYKKDKATANPELENIFRTGHEVGGEAKKLFGDYIDVTTYDGDKLNLSEMIKKTDECIKNGTNVICEASFSKDNNFCSVDLLRKVDDGYEIYEVKCSSDKHEDYTGEDDEDEEDELIGLVPKNIEKFIKKKEKYLIDIAYQKWVLEKCDINVKKVYLVDINNQYVYDGKKLDINQLFNKIDVSDLIADYYKDVAKNASDALKLISNDTEPSQALCAGCYKNGTCEFFEYCTNYLKKPNIFSVYKMWKSKKVEHYNNGCKTLSDYEKELNKILEKKKPGAVQAIQKKQLDAELHDISYIDKESIKKYLDEKLTYPAYFLDFETYQDAIPKIENTRPYQKITFQYSLHILKEKGGELEHKEFLGISGTNPMKDLARQLVKDIPKDKCVIAYNAGFERGRIKELAKMFETEDKNISEHLLNIAKNIIDIKDPFSKGYYYLKAMDGSFSIKKVLPALFPDDPSLDYHNLKGVVHNGGEAQDIFPKIKDMPQEEQEKARKDLLEYCGLDTLAMVKVVEKLYEAIK